MTDLNQLTRENIRKLVPYSSARDEYQGDATVLLDANENPFNEPLNRYPDPLQWRLKEQISNIKQVRPGNIFLGNGSDEAIDLVIRAFCEPGHNNIVSIDPTYGMYKVCADINHVEFRKVLLNSSFDLDVEALLSRTDEKTHLLFLCSPNNPTSNSFIPSDILTILNTFPGLVVLDEAYIDFSAGTGFLPELARFPNLIILQTLSKAWGLAGIRLGMAFADSRIITILNKIKYPYNINSLTLETALKSLRNISRKNEWVDSIIVQRGILKKALSSLSVIRKIYPSDANFLLVKVDQPKALYQFLTGKRIIIRDRSQVSLCEGCLRITVGTPDQNSILIHTLQQYQESRP
jgi:histidinol-phosphate aminotransferase